MTRHLIWKASLNWSYKEMGEMSQLQYWSKTKDEWKKTISDDKEGAAWIKPPKRIQFHKASTEAEGRMGLEWFSVLFPPLSLGFPHQLDAFLTIDIFSTSSEKWRLRSLSTDVRSIASTTSLWRSLSAFWRGNIVSTSEPWSVEHLNPTRWGKSQPPGQLIICWTLIYQTLTFKSFIENSPIFSTRRRHWNATW